MPRQGFAAASITDVSSSTSIAQGLPSVRLYNKGTKDVFFRFTAGSGTAVTTDVILPAGALETFTKQEKEDTLSMICASGETSTVYIAQGFGE